MLEFFLYAAGGLVALFALIVVVFLLFGWRPKRGGSAGFSNTDGGSTMF